MECLQFSCLLLIMICANGGKVGGKRSTVFHERIHLRGMTDIVLIFVFFNFVFSIFQLKKTNELSLKSRRVRYFCLLLSIPAYTQGETSSYLATGDSMKCHRSDDSQNKKQASEASDKSKYRMERKITVADI